MITIKGFRDLLENFAQNYPLLNDFGWGSPYALMNEKTLKYPCLLANLSENAGTVGNNKTVLNLQIAVIDRLLDSNKNLIDVQSDCLRIVEGLITHINSHVDFHSVGSVENASLTHVSDAMKDKVAGFILSLSIRLFNASNTCLASIPPSGGIVLIKNSDNSFSVNVTAPATYTLPDVQYEVYVDSVLVDSGNFPVYGNQVIDIDL